MVGILFRDVMSRDMYPGVLDPSESDGAVRFVKNLNPDPEPNRPRCWQSGLWCMQASYTKSDTIFGISTSKLVGVDPCAM